MYACAAKLHKCHQLWYQNRNQAISMTGAMVFLGVRMLLVIGHSNLVMPVLTRMKLLSSVLA